MRHSLDLLDEHGAADAGVFAARAARLGDGAVRLQAARGILALTAAPLAPSAWGDPTPTVLVMRTMAVAQDVSCDLVVDASALRTDGSELVLPDSAVRAAWVGVSPPRGGWEVAGDVSVEVLRAEAVAGMSAVATGVPESPGEDVVRLVRSEVWGRPVPELLGMPRGVAFAAEAMGLLGRDDRGGSVRTHTGWTRLSLRRGHVLVRRPAVAGLTPVRSTGAPEAHPGA